MSHQDSCPSHDQNLSTRQLPFIHTSTTLLKSQLLESVLLILALFLYRGGEEVLLDVGGQDATEAFEDVGHSDEAREILEGLRVGNVKRVVR